MKCSIVIAAHRKPIAVFARVLQSIYAQSPPFDWEVKIALDGSPGEYFDLCRKYQKEHSNFDWQYLPNAQYRNPGFARNAASREATGEILIQQSDEVLHVGSDVIEKLALRFNPETEVHHADVFNYDVESGRRMENYSRNNHEGNRGLFFLGAISRKLFYDIGGNDEEFTMPGYEDAYLRDCIRGRGIREVYSSDIIGYHQHHHREPHHDWYAQMKVIYDRKRVEATWTASSGPWRSEQENTNL